MSTFFSGTDLNTLREEGNDRNIFVSLIVNNAGTYTAAVTRKITCTKTISREYSYEFFGEGSKESKDTQTIQSTEIEWFNLTIDKESSSRGFEDVNTRITELQKRKVDVSDKISDKNTLIAGQGQKQIPFNWEDRKPVVTSSNRGTAIEGIKEIKESKEIKEKKPSPFEDADDVFELMINEPVDKDLLDSLLLQILTGCVFISKGIDRDKWIKSMERVYSKRFDNYLDFSNWAEFFIDFLMEDLVDKDRRLIERGFSRDEVQAIYACHLSNILLDFEENRYIKEFQENLERYYLE